MSIDDGAVRQPPFPRGLTVLMTMASAVIVIAGLRAFAASIAPLFLALIVVVVVGPVYRWLRRIGVPPTLATMGLAATAFGVLVVMITALVWTVTMLVNLLTSETYTQRISDTQRDLEAQLAEWGYTRDDLGDAFNDLDLNSVAGQVSSALSSVLGVTSAVGLILISMLFMVMDTGRFMNNLDVVRPGRPLMVQAFTDFASRTRSYFVVSTGFGLIVAVLDVIALMILGIPLALVWGVLSLITNYIPNIGFVLGLLPPAALAFFEGGWQLAVWVIVVYTVINVAIQSVIQPKFVGDAVGLSTTLTFISLIFWGWVMGPLGALLAVPLTLLAKALLIDIDPTSRWAVPLIALNPTDHSIVDDGPGPPPSDRRPPPGDGDSSNVDVADGAGESARGEAAATETEVDIEAADIEADNKGPEDSRPQPDPDR